MVTVERLDRPKVVGSINVKIVTGCGNMYIQMGWWQDSLHEVFATLGRGGGCAMSYGEALTRSITAGLRRGVPVSEYVRQLKGVRCPNPMPFPKEDAVLSCPDAIGRALEQFGSLSIEGLVRFIQDINSSDSPLDNILSESEEEMKSAVYTANMLRAEREKSGI